MTKQQLVEAIAENAGPERTKKDIDEILEAMLAEIAKALASGDRVDLRGFGSFVLKETKARQGRHPRTGEVIQIAAKRSVAFKPAKDLEQSLERQPHDVVGVP
jgi:DNA-binding protein HU-beta